MFKYSARVQWSDEDNGFIATIPELPGLSAFGETFEEAITEVQVAADAFIETLRETGESIPAPEKLISYSGQTRLRLPKSLHAGLAAAAESEGISLNTYIVSLLSERHGKKEVQKEIRRQLEPFVKSQRLVYVGGAARNFSLTEISPTVREETKNYTLEGGNS